MRYSLSSFYCTYSKKARVNGKHEWLCSVPVVINVNVKINFLIVNVQPHCNGHFCWRRELASPAAKVKCNVPVYYNRNGVRELYS